MFDIGWSELLIVAVVAIIVVGPKDLPRMLRSIGRIVGQVRRMAGEFSRQFDEVIRDSELEEVQNSIRDVTSAEPLKDFERAFERSIEEERAAAKAKGLDDIEDFDDPGAAMDDEHVRTAEGEGVDNERDGARAKAADARAEAAHANELPAASAERVSATESSVGAAGNGAGPGKAPSETVPEPQPKAEVGTRAPSEKPTKMAASAEASSAEPSLEAQGRKEGGV